MIQLMEGLPPHVPGIKATGAVSGEDYEKVLMPALENLAKQNSGEIYFLYEIDTNLSEFTIKAIWEDIKSGFTHFSKWKKIAVVTDSKVYEKIIDLFTYLLPGESKGFSPAELEEAKKWVSRKI